MENERDRKMPGKITACICCVAGALSSGPSVASAAPAVHWRGPDQNGAFPSAALPASWSPEGENLLWKAPYGSRSGVIVMDGRVFLINRAGEGVNLQERVMALDLQSGARIWEHRFNVFLTDIVAHRVGWANLAGDPETGYVYAHGVQGRFFCFDRDGNVIWSRSLTEEVGRISGYGGRTNTPIIAGDLVLISFLNSSWGPQGRGLHRYLAMDKRTGEIVYWAQPSGAPLDTTYSVPVVMERSGAQVLYTGLADGTIVAMNPATGERLWQFTLSKRGINSSVVVGDGRVYAAHSEENLDSTKMGRVVCLDAAAGTETWRIDGLAIGYTSPVLHDGVLYVSDNSANLHAIDAVSGEHLWEVNYGKEAKGSPVFADGKIFVGEVGGAYHIIAASREGGRVLHSRRFKEPSGAPIEIFGTPAVAGDKVVLPTRTDVYCIGMSSGESSATLVLAGEPAEEVPPVFGEPVALQLIPAEGWVGSGESLALRVVSLDAAGTARPETAPLLAVKGLSGFMGADHTFRADEVSRVEAGVVTAKVGEMTASARIRVIPPLPYREDFDSLPAGAPPAGWIASKLKCVVEEADGGKILRKLADRPAPPFARLRGYMLPPIDTGYTVKSDMLGVSKKNRFLPDMGLINSRYLLILVGTSERTRRLRLVSWAPIPRIQHEVEFPWSGDTWYAVKLSVDVVDGRGLVRGKVWERGNEEPEAWSIEMEDPTPNRAGSPGLYAYSVSITSKSKGTEVLYDNVEVSRNE